MFTHHGNHASLILAGCFALAAAVVSGLRIRQ